MQCGCRRGGGGGRTGRPNGDVCIWGRWGRGGEELPGGRLSPLAKAMCMYMIVAACAFQQCVWCVCVEGGAPMQASAPPLPPHAHASQTTGRVAGQGADCREAVTGGWGWGVPRAGHATRGLSHSQQPQPQGGARLPPPPAHIQLQAPLPITAQRTTQHNPRAEQLSCEAPPLPRCHWWVPIGRSVRWKLTQGAFAIACCVVALRESPGCWLAPSAPAAAAGAHLGYAPGQLMLSSSFGAPSNIACRHP